MYMRILFILYTSLSVKLCREALALHTKRPIPRLPSPYNDVDLGSQEQDATSSILEGCFSVIMGGDPQYPWTEPILKGNRKWVSRLMIENYFMAMSKVSKLTIACPLKAVMINGDLTAFGNEEELETFKQLLNNGIAEVKVPVFLGLGNHDYANNVNDCKENECASRMVTFMVIDIQQKKPLLKSKDIRVESQMVKPVAYTGFGRNCRGKMLRTSFNGSLAYSFDIGNIHFIQLHNYPTYKAEWKTNLYSDNGTGSCRYKGTLTVTIRPSLEWLEHDLRAAAVQSKPIIICFHDPIEHFKFDAGAERFKRLITEYRVAGIFVGHFHDRIGMYEQDSQRYGNVPVFASGSAIHGNFAHLTFYPRNQTMGVQWYFTTAGGNAEKIERHFIGSRLELMMQPHVVLDFPLIIVEVHQIHSEDFSLRDIDPLIICSSTTFNLLDRYCHIASKFISRSQKRFQSIAKNFSLHDVGSNLLFEYVLEFCSLFPVLRGCV